MNTNRMLSAARTLSAPPLARLSSAWLSFVASSAGVRLCFVKMAKVMVRGGERAGSPRWVLAEGCLYVVPQGTKKQGSLPSL